MTDDHVQGGTHVPRHAEPDLPASAAVVRPGVESSGADGGLTARIEDLQRRIAEHRLRLTGSPSDGSAPVDGPTGGQTGTGCG